MLPTGPHVPVRRITPEATSLGDLFRRRAKRSATSPAMYEHRGGSWRAVTWGEFYARAKRAAKQLRTHGVGRGDKIAILGPTQPSWAVFDMAAQLLGAVSFGIYPKQTPTQIRYLLEHSEAKVVLVSGKDELASVLEAAAGVATLGTIAPWEKELVEGARAKDPRVAHVDPEAGEGLDEDEVDESLSQVPKEATAIFVYTSGTTGPPKGAMISHENILTILRNASVTPWETTDETLSFLPMAHAAERVLAFYGRITYGICTSYASSVPAVLDELKEVRPTVFGSVPRIFEKAYSRIMTEVGKAPPRRQKIFRWAESTALRVVRDWQSGKESPIHVRAQYEVANRVVFAKLREAFGGRVKQFITGAAPIPKPILELFWGAGIPIYEVYGMTEATVITHANTPGAVRLGSVGRALPFIEDKIAEDGEILVRGRTVFKGYYKDPEATAAMVDSDGWLHTGDVGRKDPDGFVYILDRKKHLIITSGGKNITPSNLENAVKAQDSLISNVHAHGDKRAYCTALVTVHPLEAIEWAKERGLLSDPAAAEAMRKELMSNPLARPPGLDAIMAKVTAEPELRSRIVRAVQRANRDLSRVEAIKRIHILERDFSLEEDEITPTLKLKRKNVEKKFLELFDKLYSDDSFGTTVEGKGHE